MEAVHAGLCIKYIQTIRLRERLERKAKWLQSEMDIHMRTSMSITENQTIHIRASTSIAGNQAILIRMPAGMFPTAMCTAKRRCAL